MVVRADMYVGVGYGESGNLFRVIVDVERWVVVAEFVRGDGYLFQTWWMSINLSRTAVDDMGKLIPGGGC